MEHRFSDLIERLRTEAAAAARDAGRRPPKLSRARLRELYDDARRAALAGELPLAGHSLPTTLNAWLERFDVAGGTLKRDVDVVDFSFAAGHALDDWLDAWRTRLAPPPPPVRVSPAAFELIERVHDLGAAHRASLEATNGTKDDLRAALSDLQAHVELLLQGYDGATEALRLPPRSLPLERFRATGPKRKDEDDDADASSNGSQRPRRTKRRTKRSQKTSDTSGATAEAKS